MADRKAHLLSISAVCLVSMCLIHGFTWDQSKQAMQHCLCRNATEENNNQHAITELLAVC